ncbi:MAG: hypothetical protein KJ706_06520 [Candidatus Omnitrophica bacterium]|nr:hypothetical protein [Candidatus Omnitrophota bacterium]MBU4589678.1 hypothetical protein [Candidatus Omnitrophota bacterium]
MTKIRKELNLKIVLLLVSIVLVFSSSAYGVDLYKNSHLRPQMLFDDKQAKIKDVCTFLRILYEKSIVVGGMTKQETFVYVKKKAEQFNAKHALGIAVILLHDGIRFIVSTGQATSSLDKFELTGLRHAIKTFPEFIRTSALDLFYGEDDEALTEENDYLKNINTDLDALVDFYNNADALGKLGAVKEMISVIQDAIGVLLENGKSIHKPEILGLVSKDMKAFKAEIQVIESLVTGDGKVDIENMCGLLSRRYFQTERYSEPDLVYNIHVESAAKNVFPDIRPLNLYIILDNLFSNAKGAFSETRDKKEISINIFINGSGKWQMDFSDTGKGVPADEYENIFKPGYSSEGEGRGTGLFLTQKKVEASGGTITIDSLTLEEKERSYNKDKDKVGTTFSIQLPFKPATRGYAPLKSRAMGKFL